MGRLSAEGRLALAVSAEQAEDIERASQDSGGFKEKLIYQLAFAK